MPGKERQEKQLHEKSLEKKRKRQQQTGARAQEENVKTQRGKRDGIRAAGRRGEKT